MEKRSTTINIGGISYTVSGPETEEYMQKIGAFVNNKMEELRSACFALDTTMLAVLTAVNLADENMKLKAKNLQLQKQLDRVQTLPAQQKSAQTMLTDEGSKKGSAPKKS